MSEENRPQDTLTGRVPENRVKLWFLLGADRWVVAAISLAAVFVTLVVVGVLDAVPLREALENRDPVETLFQALVTAIITGVTLVITISQLVLSQELGSVGDQRERMEEAMEFQNSVEEVLDTEVSPPDPASFMQALIDETRARAERLTELADGKDEGSDSHLDGYVEGLRRNAEEVSDELDDAYFGSFDVVFALLDYNYSWKINEARRLRNQYEDTDVVEGLDDLIKSLELFAPAREHIKTLYFQWELINLSRAMVYSSIPALVVTASYVLYLGNSDFIPGSTLYVDNLVLLVSLGVIVALLPFALLLSYVLRITTVAKRTLAIGPFVLRGSETQNLSKPYNDESEN